METEAASRLLLGIEVPVRNGYLGHGCRCSIVHRDGTRDHCRAMVESPDQPCCDGCTENHMPGTDGHSLMDDGNRWELWMGPVPEP